MILPATNSGSPILSSMPSSIVTPISHMTLTTTKTNRCCEEGCKKKLSLTDFPCKCNKKFCSVHRAAETHSCSYDYKAQHNKELLKTMSESVSAKRVDII